MTNREFCLDRRKRERKAFVNVLKAVPQDRLEYRPDPKARTARDLAWLVAHEDGALIPLLKTGAGEWKELLPPATVGEIVATYERNAATVDDLVARMDEQTWAGTCQLSFGTAPPWEDTVENMVWGFLLDAIHHRGQLSTYLRPMGSRVPAIYGPSADDSGS